jgi:hypothetical protein
VVVVFASVLIARLLGVVRSRVRARLDQETIQPSGRRVLRLANWMSGLLSGLSLLFLVGLLLTVSQSMTTRAPQVPSYLLVLLVIPLIAAPLTLVMLAFTLLAWKHRHGSLLARVHYSLVSLAGLAFVWFAGYWSLLGFKL